MPGAARRVQTQPDKLAEQGERTVTTENIEPRPNRSPERTADRALAALRALTQATAGGYEDPAELYAVLTRLTQLAGLTKQVLDEAGQWLRAEQRAGRVGEDGESDPGTVTAAVDALTSASVQAGTLAADVDAAAGHAGHLTRGVHQA